MLEPEHRLERVAILYYEVFIDYELRTTTSFDRRLDTCNSHPKIMSKRQLINHTAHAARLGCQKN